jgi:hypothetical protein
VKPVVTQALSPQNCVAEQVMLQAWQPLSRKASWQVLPQQF